MTGNGCFVRSKNAARGGAAGRAGGEVMENLLQNIASGLWIVLGVYCSFVLRTWNKRFSELYDELKKEVE